MQVHHQWDQDEPGGIVAMMTDLMDGLASNGHRVTLLASDWQSPRPSECTDRTGRPYLRLNLAPMPPRLSNIKAMLGWLWRFPLAVWRLRCLCRDRCIDVAQLHYADALYLVFVALRWLGGPPIVVTVHRGDVMSYPTMPSLRRWGYQRVMGGASAVVAVSRALAEQARAQSAQIRRLVVIHNGYTPPFDRLLDRAALAQTLGRPLPEQFATLVGNCRPYKGQDIAVKAWAELAVSGVDLPLLVVGGGPDLEAMKALSVAHGLDRQVVFTGPVSRQMAASLTALTLVQVAPSRNEGQGIVILEAGFAGTPVICSDIAPFQEMVDDGVTGHMFPSEDTGALRDKVLAVLADRETARRGALRLRDRIVRDFSRMGMVRSYENLFAELGRFSNGRLD